MKFEISDLKLQERYNEELRITNYELPGGSEFMVMRSGLRALKFEISDLRLRDCVIGRLEIAEG